MQSWNNRAVAVAIAVVLTMTAVHVHAQVTVTIGSNQYSQELPVNYYYYSSVSEAIYTASDLAAGGWIGGSGTISSIAWNVTTASTSANGTLQIYLENTSQSAYTNYNFSTTGTLVYQAASPAFSTTGWRTFPLTTSFPYSGGNLRVKVVKSGTSWYTSYPRFAHSITGNNTHLVWYDDDTFIPTTAWYYEQYRPDVRFQITGGGNTPPSITVTSVPPCWAPATNQNVTATITDNGSISDARIWYRKGTGTWYNSTASSISGSNYTFTINAATMGGLAANDVVSWYVAAQDNQGAVTTNPLGGGGTSPTGSTPPPSVFSYTVNTPRPIPYIENFDGAPSGVTFGGTNSSWRFGVPGGAIGPTAYSTPNAMVMQTTVNQYQNNEQSWATLPALDFSAATMDPVLTFWHRYDFEGGWDGGRIETSTDCGQTWTTLGTVSDPNGMNWYTAASVNSSGGQPVWSQSSGQWVKSVRILTGMRGRSGVFIRFRGCSDGSVVYSGWAIDDIAIGEYPQKDVQLVDARLTYAPNTWGHIQNATHQVQVLLRNNGWEVPPTSLQLSLSIPGFPVINETVIPVWTAGQATITMAAPIVPPVTGTVTASLTVNYTGDMVPGNNSVTRTYTINDNKVYGYEDFVNAAPPNFTSGLPTAWTVNNVNGGPTWITEQNGAERYLSYPGSTSTADDWVFTPAAFLQAGSSYRLQFRYRSGGGTQVVDVAYGTSPNPASMTTFETFTFTTGSWTNAIGSLGVAPFFNTSATAPQNYFVGFRVRSPAAGAVHIDDIRLDVNPTPPPKIGIGAPNTAQGLHIDNASTPIQLSALYKKPGTITRTYEVVSTTYNYGAPGDYLWDVSTGTPWIKLTKSTALPTQFLASNPFNPARPRQGQTFTISIDPAGFAPGTYTGSITLLASLYNAQYPSGIKSTNEPFTLPVILTIIDPNAGAGPGGGQAACLTNMATRATPYVFRDANGVPMAAVTVTSGTIPSLCIEQFPGQLPQGIARYRYVQKYWTVTGSGSGWTATIDWYYTASEAAAGGVTRTDLLRTVRQLPSGGAWQDPTPGVASTSFPVMSYVRGTGYNPSNIGGNHCLVTSWFTPKDGASITSFELGQNYPNPFNPTTTIEYAVAEPVKVTLTVLNSLGVEVARLVDEERAAGSYSVQFDASTLPSGTYVYRMQAGDFVETRRMQLAK